MNRPRKVEIDQGGKSGMEQLKTALNVLPPSEHPGEEVYYEILCDFGIALVEYRRKHHMKQEDLAQMLHVSQAMVSKYENGTFNLSLRTMCDICAQIGYQLQVSIAGGASSNEEPKEM